MGVSFDHGDPLWSRLVDEVVSRVADQLATEVGKLLAETQGPGPWLTTAEAIKYTGLPDGTFRKLAACGKIPSHGGRSKIFYRPEIDQALLSSAGLTEDVRRLRSIR
jgi:excisionase family DNA binding protein